MSILDLIAAPLRTGTPYIPKDTGSSCRLHANELPWSPLIDAQWQLNRYPEKALQIQLENTLAAMYACAPNQLVLTRGSDEGIDLLCRLFLSKPQTAMMLSPPTFPLYVFYARLQQAKTIQCPLDETRNFQLDEEQLHAAWTPECTMIMLCTPNNPTGSVISLETIAGLCQRYQNKSVIVVDEAYNEFTQGKSAISLVKDYDNLLVLRTLSKAYGLAALRLGVIVAQSELIKAINTILPPYTFSEVVLDLAQQALQDKAWFSNCVEQVLEQREWLTKILLEIPAIEKVYTSQANFILVKSAYAQELAQFLAANGISVRDFPQGSGMQQFLRISVGEMKHNQALATALAAFPLPTSRTI